LDLAEGRRVGVAPPLERQGNGELVFHDCLVDGAVDGLDALPREAGNDKEGMRNFEPWKKRNRPTRGEKGGGEGERAATDRLTYIFAILVVPLVQRRAP